MRKLTERKVYETARQTHFGWDLRASDWGCVHWQRSPKLSPEDIANWPYRLSEPADFAPDFCVTVQGDPSDDLLTSWLEEEEKGVALTSVA